MQITVTGKVQKTIMSGFGGVASAHEKASAVGISIMKQGGNAADAATAVAMALAVVYPQAGNLGGGGFLIYRNRAGKLFVLDFRETAPSRAFSKMYLDENGKPVAHKSRLGGLAVGVPGTVKGFFEFQQKFGRLSWKEVLQPAIQLARDGFIVNKYLEKSFKSAEKYLKLFPDSRRVFMPAGRIPRAGDRLIQTDLGNSLEEIARSGDKDFYEGKIAGQIVKAVKSTGGILELSDLKNYNIIEREPTVINYSGFKIISLPPPSSAGIVLNGILNGLDFFNINKFDFNSTDYISLLTELEKRYFAIRNQLLGDPDFTHMPLNELLSAEFNRQIAREINPATPRPANEISAKKVFETESEETTHFSVVDSESNAVSVTYTLNGNFGSRLVAGNTGILLNNEMDDFAVKPGAANMFGLVQGEANSVEPGKRMLSSMSPVIVEKDDRLIGLLGSPGGPKIITTVLQVLVNLINLNMPLPQAIQAGRFHHQWLPDTIFVESAKFNADILANLKQKGYAISKRKSIGDVQAIWRSGDNWIIASDPRGNGSAAGL